MKQTLLAFFLTSLMLSCTGQQDNGKTYHSTYAIGKIPDETNFTTLTEYDKRIAAIFTTHDTELDSIARTDTTMKEMLSSQKRDFFNNRGRIHLTQYENDKPAKIDKVFKEGMPAVCECLLKQDTLEVRMAVGFFGGMAFHIAITKDSFQTAYYLYMSDGKPYKQNPTNSFTHELNVGSKYQYLVLNQQPSFREGQQLRGYVTMTSSNYYEQGSDDKLHTNYVVGIIYFTCNTKTNAW